MIPNGEQNVFLSNVQAIMEVLKKSHFSLKIGNCPIPLAEHSGHCIFCDFQIICISKVTWFCSPSKFLIF